MKYKNCKSIISLLLVAVLTVSMCLSTTVFATDMHRPFTLRVGYWPEYGVTKDINGNLSGYLHEYMREIAHINDWDVEFIPCDWNEGAAMLREGKLDVFGPMEKNEERATLYDYPSLSIGEEYGALYISDDNDSIFYDNAASLNNKTLGTIDNNYYMEALMKYCEENQISLNIVTINDEHELRNALADGKIDLRMSGNMQFHDNEKIVLRFDRNAVFCPTTKGNSFVLNGLNTALEKIQRDNTHYNAELYQRYYTQYAVEKDAFTVMETEYIKEAPPLKVGYITDGEPLESYDGENGSAKGISIDILRAISSYSGLKFEFVELSGIDEVQEKINSKEIDIMTGVISSDRFIDIYGLEPTRPLVDLSLVFIIKQGTDFKANRPVLAIPRDWPGVRHHVEIGYPEVKIVEYADINACLQAVQAQEANLTVLNTLNAERLLKESIFNKLTINSMRKGKISLCMGTQPDADPILTAVLNKSIGAIEWYTVNQIVYRHTISLPYAPSFAELVHYNIPPIMVGTALLAMALCWFFIRSRRKLNTIAFIDPLTGEMNMNKFQIEAQKLMNRGDKTNAVLVVDVDKFKAINGLYGYEFGDRILLILALSLRESLLPGTIMCHGGADKFYMFFEFHGDDWMKVEFSKLAERVDLAIAEKIPSCHIVLSGGVCVVQPEDKNVVAIIDRANIASRHVKSYHESIFAFYDQAMYDRINQTRNIESSMSASLRNEEFIVHLQPKIDLSTKKIAGAEALVRWQHPQNGLISPGEFIPLFEENGFIVNMDFYILEEICNLLERWKRENRQLFTISVNLSRRHLFYVDTAEKLYAIVSRYEVDPCLIEFELTESAFDNCDIPTIISLFNTLHDLGFTVSVDDFGAGYSSLALLKDLPIDVLKIDKTFFDFRQTSKLGKMWILLESIISLSRKLNIKTVSEGVETEDQVKLLVELGCDLVQGFYFARPMPIATLEGLLENGVPFGPQTTAAVEKV